MRRHLLLTVLPTLAIPIVAWAFISPASLFRSDNSLTITKMIETADLGTRISGMDVKVALAEPRPGGASVHGVVSCDLENKTSWATVMAVEIYTYREDEQTGRAILSEQPVQTLEAGPYQIRGGDGGIYSVDAAVSLPPGDYKGWINLYLDEDGRLELRAGQSFRFTVL